MIWKVKGKCIYVIMCEKFVFFLRIYEVYYVIVFVFVEKYYIDFCSCVIVVLYFSLDEDLIVVIRGVFGVM